MVISARIKKKTSCHHEYPAIVDRGLSGGGRPPSASPCPLDARLLSGATALLASARIFCPLALLMASGAAALLAAYGCSLALAAALLAAYGCSLARAAALLAAYGCSLAFT